MSEEPIKTEGGSPARAGETARQLIRRAEQASRWKFPSEEKIRFVLKGVRAEVSVADGINHNHLDVTHCPLRPQKRGRILADDEGFKGNVLAHLSRRPVDRGGC